MKSAQPDNKYNREPETTRIFQIWILPDRQGEKPSWGTKPFPKGERSGHFVTLASGMAGDDDALPIRSNARVAGATLKAGEHVEYTLADRRRHVYLVPASGKVKIDGLTLNARDGAAITDESVIRIEALEDSELVLVDAA